MIKYEVSTFDETIFSQTAADVRNEVAPHVIKKSYDRQVVPLRPRGTRPSKGPTSQKTQGCRSANEIATVHLRTPRPTLSDQNMAS
jgi:hypothetical protein